jgi:enoyl-CoA hydratase/carnithine racemase
VATHRIQVPALLGAATLGTLRDAVEGVVSDPTRSLVLLEGAPGVFCRGLDLGVLLEPGKGRSVEEEADLAFAEFAGCLWLLRRAGKPVMAVVDGEVLGGGIGLVAAADLVIATDRSTFGLPEVLFGLIPAAVLPFLFERVPPQKARLAALVGASYDAVAAHALGLVDVLTTADGLERTVDIQVRALLRASPRAVGALKRFTLEVASRETDAALRRGVDLSRSLLADERVREAIRGFLTGGAVPWGAEEESSE